MVAQILTPWGKFSVHDDERAYTGVCISPGKLFKSSHSMAGKRLTCTDYSTYKRWVSFDTAEPNQEPLFPRRKLPRVALVLDQLRRGRCYLNTQGCILNKYKSTCAVNPLTFVLRTWPSVNFSSAQELPSLAVTFPALRIPSLFSRLNCHSAYNV